MDIDFVFSLPFTKKQLTEYGVQSHREFNGVYDYDKDKVYINLGSSDFALEPGDTYTEDDIIDLVSRTTTHESLHSVIHDIRGIKKSSPGEEKVVMLMSNQMDWKTKRITYGEVKRN